ncbi:MAG: TIGR04283 family arsenosugar biosynthesis glycosyltransferase [Elusimicrobia bacterium]|nr:TIGR04283 family arsenosugar biosynthesis glycosyltransferase [Elusimicrobiota bacterium]
MLLSVIVPTFNEAEILPGLLAHLRATATSAVEIIVADGQSKDSTLDAAQFLADRTVSAQRPRARQMHEGALAAKGDLFLFLHADTLLPDDWQNILLEAWSNGHHHSATAFEIGFDAQGWPYRLIEAAARWRRSLTGVPHGDQAIAVSREHYFEAGGFPEMPLMEEYALVGKLKHLGPVHVLPQQVRTSKRRHEKNGPLLNGLKNNAIIACYYLGLPPELLAKIYR